MSLYDLAIELSYSHTTIYKNGVGVILSEPSLVAVVLNGKKREYKCVGDDAYKYIKNPEDNIQVYEPIVEGTIINKQLANMLLKELIKKTGVVRFSKLKVAIAVPVGITQKERAALLDLAYSLNFHSVALIPTGVASLVGLQVDITKQNSHIVVNVGGGISDVAVVTGASIVRGGSVTISGDSLQKVIDSYLREERALILHDYDKHLLISEIISLYENDENKITLSCIDADTKNIVEATITAKELFPITKFFFTKLIECVATMINMSSSDIIADVSRFGIYVCGELSNITGLDRFFADNLQYPVYLDPDSAKTAIYGLGAIIEDEKLFDLATANLG